MSRPREHELEEESRRAFSNYLPIQWVRDEPKEDYGIDHIVYIYDHGNITPFSFYVQVKSSDYLEYKDNIPRYPFKTQRLREYNEQHIPVMLLLYDAKTGKLYYDWVQNLIEHFDDKMRSKLHNQKTMKIDLQYSLTDLKHDQLEHEVKTLFYQMGFDRKQDILKIAIPIKHEEDIGKWLAKYNFIDFIVIQKNSANIQILLDDNSNQLEIVSGRESYTYQYLNQLSEIEQKLIIKYAIAFVLSIAGRTKYALDILSDLMTNYEITNEVKYTFFYNESLPKFYAKADRILEALEMAEFLLERYEVHVAFILSSTILYSEEKAEKYSVKYRKLLIEFINHSPDNFFEAAMFYNLANNLSYNGYYLKSLRCYNKASKLNGDYLKKAYWFSEVGACLFNLNRYEWAKNYYDYAIKLAAPEDKYLIKKFRGDCFLYQGQFRKACMNFEQKGTYMPDAESVLKGWISRKLYEEFGDTKRNVKLANDEIYLIENSTDIASLQDQYRKVLQFDPLNALAWYNYASSLEDASSLKVDALIIAATMSYWDIESWAKGLVYINLVDDNKVHEIAEPFLIMAYGLFKNELRYEMKRLCQVDDEEFLVQFIDNILSTYKQLSFKYKTNEKVKSRYFAYYTK